MRECVAAVVEVPAACLEAGLRVGGLGPPPPPSALEQRQLQAIWKLRAAFDAAADGRLPISELLGRVASALATSSQTVLAWAGAIESLIQEIETLYGPEPGQGAEKAAQVKAAAFYAVEQSIGASVGNHSLVNRAVVEMALDWLVDGLVLVLNKHELWALTPGQRLAALRWLRLRTRVAAFALKVVAFLYAWLVRSTPLAPPVRRIVDEMLADERYNLVDNGRELAEFFAWSVEHRRQLLALVEIVAVACLEAEDLLLEMTGPQKREYAESLVFRIIAMECPDLVSSAFSDQLLRGLIGIWIDMIVGVFNKHRHFEHRRAQAALPAVGVA